MSLMEQFLILLSMSAPLTANVASAAEAIDIDLNADLEVNLTDSEIPETKK